MAEDKGKDSKDSKDTKDRRSKEEEPYVTGTGRTAMPHEGDPKAAAEAATSGGSVVAAGPVEADEAEPGQPVVDPNPAYDPEAPENQSTNEDGSGETAKSAGRKDDDDQK
jgi:hypothetical protein